MRATRVGRALLALGALLVLVAPTTPATASASSSVSPRVQLEAVDGGPGFTSRFIGGAASASSFFPVGVWYESVVDDADVATDRAAGLNTYVQLTATSDLALAREAGMDVVTDASASGDASAVSGWLLSDEIDMHLGPGWGAVRDPLGAPDCLTAQGCGYTAMQDRLDQLPDDGRVRYANYGKGVTFWESDEEAQEFVNRFQDVVSADNYWFTDPNICGASEGGALLAGGTRALTPSECRRASNYGATVDRMRSLVRPAVSKPVWAFVEVGHPFTEDAAPTIRPAQVRAAVWSSLIHGARGIIYFNHSFGGDCVTQHALRDPCYDATRRVVTSTNRQIAELAPVLNAPTVRGATSVSGAVDTMTKWSGGQYWVFAGSRAVRAQQARIRLACTGDATATVLGEDRSVPVRNGRFVDRFADGDAVHLYRIDGATTCTPS